MHSRNPGAPGDTSAASFQTTRWSVVLSAGGPGSSESTQALAQLCERYWPPLYAYVRRRGYAAEAAQDLTQAFAQDVRAHRNRVAVGERHDLLRGVPHQQQRAGGAPREQALQQAREGRPLQRAPQIAARYAVIGSLMLYISFVNLFLAILRILGSRR
jgi:hypothetical protein